MIGFVCTGVPSDEAFARLPAVARRVGPVVSPSTRLAMRIAETLGAGTPACDYQALKRVRTVLVCGPHDAVRQAAQDMAAAGIDWHGKIALIYDSVLDSSALHPVALCGAAIGSFASIEPWEELGFVVEGTREAVREARRIIRSGRRRIHEMPRAKKALYLAGLALGTRLFSPLLLASVRCLRGAGFTAGAAVELAERTIEHTMRTNLHPGARSRSRCRRPEPPLLTIQQLDALRRTDPVLARYLHLAEAAASELQDGLRS